MFTSLSHFQKLCLLIELKIPLLSILLLHNTIVKRNYNVRFYYAYNKSFLHNVSSSHYQISMYVNCHSIVRQTALQTTWLLLLFYNESLYLSLCLTYSTTPQSTKRPIPSQYRPFIYSYTAADAFTTTDIIADVLSSTLH